MNRAAGETVASHLATIRARLAELTARADARRARDAEREGRGAELVEMVELDTLREDAQLADAAARAPRPARRPRPAVAPEYVTTPTPSAGHPQNSDELRDGARPSPAAVPAVPESMNSEGAKCPLPDSGAATHGIRKLPQAGAGADWRARWARIEATVLVCRLAPPAATCDPFDGLLGRPEIRTGEDVRCPGSPTPDWPLVVTESPAQLVPAQAQEVVHHGRFIGFDPEAVGHETAERLDGRSGDRHPRLEVDEPPFDVSVQLGEVARADDQVGRRDQRRYRAGNGADERVLLHGRADRRRPHEQGQAGRDAPEAAKVEFATVVVPLRDPDVVEQVLPLGFDLRCHRFWSLGGVGFGRGLPTGPSSEVRTVLLALGSPLVDLFAGFGLGGFCCGLVPIVLRSPVFHERVSGSASPRTLSAGRPGAFGSCIPGGPVSLRSMRLTGAAVHVLPTGPPVETDLPRAA